LRTRSRFALALLLAAAFAASAAPADPEAGRLKAQPCIACHGPGGNSDNPAVPSLASQAPLYIYYQLIQFREGRRVNEQMTPFAAKLTDAEMKDIAAYFSAQPPHVPQNALEAAQIEAGQAIAARNHCDSCHMPTYAGQKHIPRLASQHYAYLVKELRGFKTGARPDIDGSMASAAQPLSDKDMTDMAAYLAGLK
jgi:cytochrome c553